MITWQNQVNQFCVVVFFLQEKEQMQSYNQRMVEILKAKQQLEKSRLPKIQRSEAKTRMTMFKKSLRIASSGSAAEDKEKIKLVRQRGFLTPYSHIQVTI